MNDAETDRAPDGEAPAISETVSETPKPKRGRPRVIPDDYRAIFQAYGLFTDVTTERGRQNIAYRQRALRVLGNDPRFKWVADRDAMRRGDPGSFRPTILAELGRIADDDQLREMALEVCRVKPTTRRAVAAVRRWRLGRSGVGDADGLLDELIRHVDDYLDRYPETPPAALVEAVSELLEAVESFGPEAPDASGPDQEDRSRCGR
jgi:hypothetical protein